MILVDTSVMIGYLRGDDNKKINIFAQIVARDIPFGISPFTYQEVLQGARDEKDYVTMRKYLINQHFFALNGGLASHDSAAHMYYDLRRNGITIRSTINLLIAMTAIENSASLLHNDRDFDNIAKHVSDLQILTSL